MYDEIDIRDLMRVIGSSQLSVDKQLNIYDVGDRFDTQRVSYLKRDMLNQMAQYIVDNLPEPARTFKSKDAIIDTYTLKTWVLTQDQFDVIMDTLYSLTQVFKSPVVKIARKKPFEIMESGRTPKPES